MMNQMINQNIRHWYVFLIRQSIDLIKMQKYVCFIVGLESSYQYQCYHQYQY